MDNFLVDIPVSSEMVKLMDAFVKYLDNDPIAMKVHVERFSQYSQDYEVVLCVEESVSAYFDVSSQRCEAKAVLCRHIWEKGEYSKAFPSVFQTVYATHF